MAEETAGQAGEKHGPVATGRRKGLIYRQSAWTRATHWVWAICLFFLLLSGLQIFNARPDLYIGQQSGFGFDNTVLSMSAERTPDGPRGYTTIFGHKFDTTGVFGLSGGERLNVQGFPSWATIPSFRDLATGRVVHFFFAWLFAATLLVWLVASIANRHLWRDVVPKGRDFRNIGHDIVLHLKFQFGHAARYNALQKISYSVVLIVFFPLMVLTGLTMSPAMNAAWPWLVDLFGGRQTARTIHFAVMALLVLFFVVHIAMVVAAGPINGLRSMITGWYRSDSTEEEKSDGQ